MHKTKTPTNVADLIALAKARHDKVKHRADLNEGERWLKRWMNEEKVSSFEMALTEALTCADAASLLNLYHAYPEHVVALIGLRNIKDFAKRIVYPDFAH